LFKFCHGICWTFIWDLHEIQYCSFVGIHHPSITSYQIHSK
jgi:hypothetical protein